MGLWGWIKELLQSRELNSGPDGRALYSYRLKKDQYELLKSTLKRSTVSDPSWAACFVFFAAEWWRREYTGGAWAWAPIFSAVNVNSMNLTATQRSQIIEDGLRYWRRPLRGAGQTEYLGSIILEGGLPLRRFQEGGTDRLLPLLKKSSQQLIARHKFGLTGIDVIDANKADLPQIFQMDAVCALLGEIVEVCLKLRLQYSLDQKPDPVMWLNQNIQEWKYDFPLDMEDDSAKALLEILIKETAHSEIEDNAFEIRRSLVEGRNNDFELRAEVILPKSVSGDMLKSFGSNPTESYMTLIAIVGDNAFPAANLGLIGSAYRIRRVDVTIPQKQSFEEISLRLASSRTNEIIGDYIPHGGAELDDDFPWVFIEDEGQKHFLGQGNVSVKSESCFVALKEATQYHCDGILESVGKLPEKRREIFKLTGTLEVDIVGNKVKIKTKQEIIQAFDYLLEGKRLPWISRPSHIFRGFPKILAFSASGTVKEFKRQNIKWRPVGVSQWSIVTDDAAGVMEVAAFENGLVLFRKRIAVINSNAKIRFNPGKNIQSGSIILENFGEVEASVASDLMWEINKEQSQQVLSLSVYKHQPPPCVEVQVQWSAQPTKLSLELPFPVSGAKFFDGEEALERGGILFAGKLQGIHARLFNQSDTGPSTVTVEMYLENNSQISFVKTLPKVDDYAEIRMAHYYDAVQKLFSSAENIDTLVVFKILVNGIEKERAYIQRYEAKVIVKNTDRFFQLQSVRDDRQSGQDFLTGAEILSLPIWLPGRTPVKLQQTFLNGLAEGTYTFDINADPGPWLIYPGINSNVIFRPQIKLISGNVQPLTQCALALSCISAEERDLKIDTQLEVMACDINHSGWMFTEQTIRKLGHLPLNTIDLFRRMVRFPDIMAMSVLLLDIPNFDFQRFSRDFPFAWECVTLKSWERAFRFLSDRTCNLDKDLRIFIIKQKLDSISSLIPQIGASYLGERLQDLDWRGKDLPSSVWQQLMSEAVQELLRDTHAASRWPELNNLDSVSVPTEFQSLNLMLEEFASDIPHRRSVLLTPFKLGIGWLLDADFFELSRNPSNKYIKIQEIEAFHTLWYRNAMLYTIAFGIAQLREKKK